MGGVFQYISSFSRLILVMVVVFFSTFVLVLMETTTSLKSVLRTFVGRREFLPDAVVVLKDQKKLGMIF
jgi:hypothetical protein